MHTALNMAERPFRREILQALGVAVTAAVAGCGSVLGRPAIPLIATSERNEAHTITVERTEVNADSSRTFTFDVAPGEKAKHSGFIAEPGRYRVVARLETGETAHLGANILDFSQGLDNREIYVDIGRGSFLIYAPSGL